MKMLISDLFNPILARMKGPGGLYLTGDILGLVVGLGVAIGTTPGAGDLSSAAKTAARFLTGSPAAVALTVATSIFLWSCAHYHQAWKTTRPIPTRTASAT